MFETLFATLSSFFFPSKEHLSTVIHLHDSFNQLQKATSLEAAIFLITWLYISLPIH